MKRTKKRTEPTDVLFRIKRGLAGYVSYLPACEMNEAFSRYVLYEPMLRILTARGFSVKCESPCLWLVERGAVIGAALDGWMLVKDWARGRTTPQSANLRLERVVDHIDHVCQIAGNIRHIGIGSDLDGAFGREQTPLGLDTIADLTKMRGLLAERGSGADDVEAISHGNFINFLQKNWK